MYANKLYHHRKMFVGATIHAHLCIEHEMENGCRKLLGTPNAEAFLVGLYGRIRYSAVWPKYNVCKRIDIIYACYYRKWKKYNVCDIIPI